MRSHIVARALDAPRRLVPPPNPGVGGAAQLKLAK